MVYVYSITKSEPLVMPRGKPLLDLYASSKQLNSGSDGSTYRVTIVLVGGDRLPLTSYYSSGTKSKQETASCIKSFLSLNN
ncbi:MAG: hypothetical protein DSM106950_32570 [Stigonema ocellatum SAG 48.90 = DSM 106950]|nr:hypothetical protein [Stigonema ocellatum SAG 48.90 = DSM 106950]